MMRDSGRLIVTYGHDGPWNLSNETDEMRFSMEAFGAQMELRAIQRRNRESAQQMRDAGRPRGKAAYGFRHVRIVPNGRVDHTEIDPEAAGIIRKVAERILADESGMITVYTEAVRLNREGVLSPADHRATLYGRPPKGGIWRPATLLGILTSEAALGYLMHGDRPVLDSEGRPIRISDEPLWDHATRTALIAKTAPKPETAPRAPKTNALLSGLAFCGQCGQRLYISSPAKASKGPNYACLGRAKGIPSSATCKPGPTMSISALNQLVADKFIEEGEGIRLWRRVPHAGTGYAARISELEAHRKRLRDDRQAGIYDSPEDTAMFRRAYATATQELDKLRALPDVPAGIHWEPTGKTAADEWREAPDDGARRELLMEYGYRVVLWPRTAEKRVWIHNLDPSVEDDVRRADWEHYQMISAAQDEIRSREEADAFAAEQAADAEAAENTDRAGWPDENEIAAGRWPMPEPDPETVDV
jgi:hypothetical protein